MVKANAFPYYSPPFREYNVVQAAVVPYLDKDVNLVVSFATATGKTVLAECCFAYHLSQHPKCRVVYVCPYRSLAAEKAGEWTKNSHFSIYGIVLGTGDVAAGPQDHMAGRLSVTTTESFDSKTRSVSYAEWIGSLECVVFDEAHLIGEKGRGPAVEAAMMRLSRANPNARMVLLSATMGNAKKLAGWVRSLNGKETKCITSSWRPSKVDTEYVPFASYDDKVSEAVRLAGEASNGKAVVFVHSKTTGVEIVKRLRAFGVKSAFHNASVPPLRRKRIEAAFNDRMSRLNVLVSTSTLGAGVNIGV